MHDKNKLNITYTTESPRDQLTQLNLHCYTPGSSILSWTSVNSFQPSFAIWCRKTWSTLVQVMRQISRSHGSKNRWIWPKFGVSRLLLQFEFINGYEMWHKAWNSKGEMPYCFSRSTIKFQGHTVQNITDFDPNWAFPDYRPVAAFKSLRFALF